MRRLPSRALLAATAVLLACATVPPGPPAPPPELAFQGVRAVALLHRSEPPGSRPGEPRRRDPLDALAAGLEARGVRTVEVELGDPLPPELQPVDRAARAAEWGARGARSGWEAPAAFALGAEAATVLERLGVDAFAVYARDTVGPFAPPPPPLVGPAFAGAPPGAPAATAWLCAVARDGTAVAWSWGGRGAPAGAGPANAAEAVDAALALLAPPPAE